MSSQKVSGELALIAGAMGVITRSQKFIFNRKFNVEDGNVLT